MGAFCAEMGVVPPMDSFNPLACTGIPAQPGRAVIERISHTGYLRDVSNEPSSELLARSGMDLCRVTFPYFL